MNVRRRASKVAAAGSTLSLAALLAVSVSASAQKLPPEPARLISAPSTARTVTIPATKPWTDTDIKLGQQERFTIKANGTASPSPGSVVTPAGVPFKNQDCANNQYAGLTAIPFVAPGLSCYALIGRIGSSSIVFKVGSHFSLKAPQGGELSLGFNDSYFGDNSGSFAVTITTK